MCRLGPHAAASAATSTPATAAATAAAGLPNGSGHAAKYAKHDGNELWGTDASRSHANAGGFLANIYSLLHGVGA